jgi:hypothetical protein
LICMPHELIDLVSIPYDLIEGVRTCRPEERREAAMRLSLLNFDEAYLELLRMAQGSTRITDRTLQSFGRRVPILYTTNEQLFAIEALGQSKRQEALTYLKFIYTAFIVNDTEWAHDCGHDDENSWMDHYTVRIHHYPYAPAGLQESLRFQVSITSPVGCGKETSQDDTIISTDAEKEIANSQSHQVIRNAISKLEISLHHSD